MCGRFTLTYPDADMLAEALGAVLDPDAAAAYRPRYNAAPSETYLVLRSASGRRELVPASWGFVTAWQHEGRAAPQPINARSETAATSRVFREAMERGRCVVPVDGFFEWTGPKKARRPIWFHPPGGGLLLLAGLYTGTHGGRDPRTFTILTTAANDVLAKVHDRMPLVLPSSEVERWLDPRVSAGGVRDLLVVAPNDTVTGTRVSTRVSSVANDDPSCLTPEEDAPEPERDAPQLGLFDVAGRARR